MPVIADATDLDLIEQGLATLQDIEDEGPVLANRLQCMVIGPLTHWKIGTLHDWSVPFLAKDWDDQGERIWSEVQECYRCRAVRAARFGPYLTPIAIRPLSIGGPS